MQPPEFAHLSNSHQSSTPRRMCRCSAIFLCEPARPPLLFLCIFARIRDLARTARPRMEAATRLHGRSSSAPLLARGGGARAQWLIRAREPRHRSSRWRSLPVRGGSPRGPRHQSSRAAAKLACTQRLPLARSTRWRSSPAAPERAGHRLLEARGGADILHQMGCVSSAFLEEEAEDGRRRIISHHHVVSLTSSTYGILTYSSDAEPVHSPPPPPTTTTTTSAPPPPPPPPTNLNPESHPHPQPQPEEVINSWELMAGLLDPSTPARPPAPSPSCKPKRRIRFPLRPIDGNAKPGAGAPPPAPAVLYTTSLRGVRATFEACNAVRAALQAHGVAFRERDVSMDRGFREELRQLLSPAACSLPRLFVRGRHVGGAEEVLRLDEQGLLAPLLEGLPRGTYCCDGCGGMSFLPCFDCSGSRKVPVPGTQPGCRRRRTTVVVRCGECNENGLVLCPICS
ncbi:hypothetical protein C2845_PM12G00340 [Panicum miliaceum]|uniref:Glutaredoxin domain-containing protein n=1 Tax=Panicum miliaceum TaxID=4540 RepID=A0A3L6QGX1_PANMI|nr:hypothetical protein C2845_PM12G00340 [Panicum miliaceum]